MKKTIFAIALLFGTSSLLFSQEKTEQTQANDDAKIETLSPQNQANIRVERIISYLEIAKERQKPIVEILNKYYAVSAEFKQRAKQQPEVADDIKKSLKTMLENRNKDLKKILTKEEFEKFMKKYADK